MGKVKDNNFKKAQLIMGLIFVIFGILGFYSVITDKILHGVPYALGAITMEASMFILWGFREIIGSELR